jgi:NADPH-dependent 2,4-dienoyl-CoA reductase/sulfur reductase-like enzyme
VVEALDWVLPTLLDFEVAAYVARHLRDKGVNLKFGERVLGFEGDGQGWVRRVMTRDGELDAGLVLLAIGVRPNTALAGEAGLDTGPAGGISVNRYLQTSDGDIYAGGDCVENINLITGQPMLAPLGSTANKQGRVIGSNATGGSDTFPGVLGTAVVKVFDCNVGRVGLSQWQAEQAGYQVSASLVPSHDHATYYPGSKEIMVKLVADKATRRLLGGQVTGPGEAAKRIDVLATALSFGATVDDLSNLDLAYAPPYNSALDPLHHAANVIRNKQSGQARALTPM